MPREKLATPAPKPVNDKFTSSGSTLLDLVLGGGWARSRIANIVGDRSAGKSLLAFEAFANFNGPSRLAETEHALDPTFAHKMGLPAHTQIADDIDTVEKFDADLGRWIGSNKKSMYAVDSLDALSDAKEMERELGDATYGTAKAKLLSEMFRTRIAEIENAGCTMLVISQIRDKIGVMFGERHQRAGGKALDFYCSQIVWLSEIEKVQRTVMGAKRPIGVKVLANNKKNKVGIPFRRAEFTILFNYGIDDETSMLEWMVSNKAEKELDASVAEYKDMIADMRAERDRAALRNLASYLRQVVTDRWNKIEEALAPPLSKYE